MHARALSNAFRVAAEKALPSVVKVLCRKEHSDQPMLDIIGGRDEQVYESVGSGVIVNQDGLILTNHHVIADTKHIDIRLFDGRQFVAESIKSDPASDLAILHIKNAPSLVTATLGDASTLHVGDWVLAIGSPFALEASVSAGIISRTECQRELSKVVKGVFLQTDAAINPGNSGGPLIDLNGDVIGINTAISSQSGGFQGVGFAIPINRAKWIEKELLEFGEVRRAKIGVKAQRLTYDLSQQLNLPQNQGVQINSVAFNRPGQKAGLKAGDVIIEVGGQNFVHSQFSEIVQRSAIGQPLKLTIIRDGQRQELTVEPEAEK